MPPWSGPAAGSGSPRRGCRHWHPTAASSPGEPQALGCDCLLVSGGWNPTVHLFSQSRGKLRFDADAAAFVPSQSVQPERSAGSANGSHSLAACFAEGAQAGAEAARAAGFSATTPTVPPVREPEQSPLLPTWAVPSRVPASRAKAFVDFQNDVTAKDLGLAVREGFQSIEHVKRYTTTGMGTDQGKTSNVNALAIVADKRGIPIEAVGTTTFRMPYTPVTFGALAGPHGGELFDPIRRTPSHDWATARGAVFEDVGNWKRARYFPQPGEDMHAAVRRECLAVREGVGLFDASTLGKIDLQGKDSAEFLNRIYTNAWTKLAVGRCRYGLMLRDDGMVFDDGVTARLGAGHFHMTTTTGGAARVLAWLEEWLQTEWPQLEVYCTSVTEEWAALAVVGPKSREVLQALGTDIDLGGEALPHLGFATGTVAGMPARVFRISFSGEIGLRGERPLGLWRGFVGGALGCRSALRHHCLRHRGHARAARREGLHHRRPGHGWHGDALRSRHGLDRRQVEAGLPRQARPAAVRPARDGAKAARRPADPGPGRGPGGGRPDRRHRRAGQTSGADDRPCHLQLSQPHARPLDRAGAGPRRARSAWRDHPRADAGTGDPGQGRAAGVRRSRRQAAEWLSPPARARSPACPLTRSPVPNRSRSIPCPSAASSCCAAERRSMPRRRGCSARSCPALMASAETGRADVLGLGPDEWLILAEPDNVGALATELSAALGTVHHAVVVVSDRMIGIGVAGRRARDVLAAGCPLDLHPAVFAPGAATRTLLGKAAVVLRRPDPAERYELWVNGSFAPYLWLFLRNAALEFGVTAAA